MEESPQNDAEKIDPQKRIFETPLEDIINMKHPLVILSSRID